MKLSILLLLSVIQVVATRAQDAAEGALYVTDCYTYTESAYFHFEPLEWTMRQKVFSEEAYVYCSPDAGSTLIDTLEFNSDIMVSGLISLFREDTIFSTDSETLERSIADTFFAPDGEWYRIEDNKRSAFIRKDDVALEDHSYEGYLAGMKTGRDIYTIELRSFSDSDEHRIMDRYAFQYLSHAYEMHTIPFNGLKDSGKIVKYRTFTQSCPSSELNEFVSMNNGEFRQVVSCAGGGEAGEYDIETVYLPMKFENGKVLLVANADLVNIFNAQTAELNTYPYPKGSTVPIEQMIVKTRVYTEVIFDKDGEPVMVDEYKVKVKVIKERPQYYQWKNGELAIPEKIEK